jgi:bacillopeptidase F
MRKDPAISLTTLLLVLLLVVSAVPLAGPAEGDGGLDPSLRRTAERCAPDSVLSVVVMLRDAGEARALRARLLATGAGKRETHRLLMESMREESRRDQEELLARLRSVQALPFVKRVRRFWLANLMVTDIEAQGLTVLAGLPGVEKVIPNRTVTLDRLGGKGGETPQGAGWNLSKIHAPSLWSDGITGRGVLLCLIDSGADGTHPALAGKWRGANVPGSSAAWHDPYNFSDFPVDDDENLGPTHGTSVAGILVGSDAGDTVGVAPGAQWIAANAFEGTFQSATYEVIIDCLEWAADPDGDPGTISDVPDVVNNSWGTNAEGGAGLCDDVLWAAIDALEALGPVVIFSAGNYGPADMSIASPASRIESDVNTMAVGATDDLDLIASFSARGPSPCDGLTVKPEVVAPGVDIRSARGLVAGGGYQYVSGTSFSSPHVTGLAALLRQISPTSSGDELKRAILTSARDLGSPGEDDAYGTGIIDAERARSGLAGASSPVLRIETVEPAPLLFVAGDTLELTVRLTNMGADAAGVQVEISDESGLIDVLDSSTDLGAIESQGQADNSSDPFLLATRSGAAQGNAVRLRLLIITASGEEECLLTGFVGEATAAGHVDHQAGNVIFTVTNFGQYGYWNGVRQVGSGFRFPRGGPDWLFSAFFLAGIGPSQVSDGLGGIDTDWRPADGGGISILRSGGKADEEAGALIEDLVAPDPLGLHVAQTSFAFSDPERGDFIILQYLIRQVSLQELSGLYAGLYFDWDVDQYSYSSNQVGWVDSLSLGYMHDADFEEHVGIALLEGTLASHRAIDNQEELYDAFGNFSFTDAKKWSFLTAGFEKPVSTSPRDWSHMLSAGPFDVLSQGDTVEVAFAVVAGMGLEDLLENAGAAREAWSDILTDPPPTFLISILPDPIVSEFLTLSAVPSESLAALPVIAVDADTLTVSPIHSGDLEFYGANYEVKAEGDHQVMVSGVDLTQNTGISTEWFTALRVGPGEGGRVQALDGTFALTLPVGAVGFEGYIYLVPSHERVPPLPAGLVALSGTYSISPQGLALNEPATVSFRSEAFEVSGDSLLVLCLADDDWTVLEVTARTEDEVRAATPIFGSFILARGGGVSALPRVFLLSQNFPNPFNPATTVLYDVPEGSGRVRVRLEIFNLRGQRMRILLDREEVPGRHEVVWDGRDAQGRRAVSGVYLCTMTAGGFSQTRKMVLLK